MTSDEIVSYANSRLRYFIAKGLIAKQWSFQWSRGRRQLGSCHYTPKYITLSIHYVAVATDEEVKDTVNHEIAHIIAGPYAHHGPEWRKACVITGAKPLRCAKNVDVPSKYIGTCQVCNHKYKANRMLKNMNRRICAKEACRRPGLYIKWNINRGVLV